MATAKQFKPVLSATPLVEYFSVLGVRVGAVQIPVANLLNVPVVAVFGPQRPEWFGSRGAQDRVEIRSEFWCRPSFDYCIYDQPYCLRAIGPEQVIQEISAATEEIRGAMHRAVEKSVGAAAS
jgi:hypothetical protein